MLTSERFTFWESQFKCQLPHSEWLWCITKPSADSDWCMQRSRNKRHPQEWQCENEVDLTWGEDGGGKAALLQCEWKPFHDKWKRRPLNNDTIKNVTPDNGGLLFHFSEIRCTGWICHRQWEVTNCSNEWRRMMISLILGFVCRIQILPLPQWKNGRTQTTEPLSAGQKGR